MPFSKDPPDDSVLLRLHTTQKAGLPNAIPTAKEMEKNGPVTGIRSDRGDLAYLTTEQGKAVSGS